MFRVGQGPTGAGEEEDENIRAGQHVERVLKLACLVACLFSRDCAARCFSAGMQALLGEGGLPNKC